jgi:hypothetical protein
LKAAFQPHLKRIVLILMLLLTPAAALETFSQTGGKKREGKTKRRGEFHLFQYKSKGHADEFARGNSGRRGLWARLFRKETPAWQYRKSGSARSNYKENRFLFFRFRSKGRDENAMTTDRQNKDRARKREHGNRVFKFKKYKTKK